MDSNNRPSSALLRLATLLLLFSVSAAQSFRCTSSTTSCAAAVGYFTRNATTLAAVKNLFNVKNFRSLLGANNLPTSTLPSHSFPPNSTIKVPIHCSCSNSTGVSKKPVYTVVPGDFLDHIAVEVFSRLVTYQQIEAVNNITDLIVPGEKLQIPLPCSCDDVDGQKVVHYAHLVAAGSTVEGIANQYGTSQDTLLRLNRLASPRELLANSVLDVPLKACASSVSNNSLDYPLLVPNGTYVFAAANCVKCNCDTANNWTLKCEPSRGNSSLWQSCPSMQCQGSTLYIGNSASSGCNQTTCAYAGYTNQTILTSIVPESTCPAGSNNSSAIGSQTWRSNFLIVSAHLLFLCIYVF